MKCFKLMFLCLISILPASGYAQSAATQPAKNPGAVDNGPSGRFDRHRGFDGFGGGYYRMGFGGRLRQDAPSPGEWEEISAFMKEHSPERFKSLINLPEGPRRMNLVALASRNYRNLQRARSEQPEVADVMVNRIELEDQVFKLANQVKSDKSRRDGPDEQLLKQKIGELIDMNMKERELRIARLEKTLQGEQNLLDQDTKNHDQLVEQRMHAFLDGSRAQASPQDSRDQPERPTTQP